MSVVAAGCESEFSSGEYDFVSSTKRKFQNHKRQNFQEPLPKPEKKLINWASIKEDSLLHSQSNQTLEIIDNTKVEVLLNEENIKRVIASEDLKTLEKLLKRGLNLNMLINTKFSLLAYSVLLNKMKTIELLLKSGVRDVENSISPILTLCSGQYSSKLHQDSSLKILTMLLDHNINVNFLSNDKSNCIHAAIKGSNEHFIPNLVSAGADIHHKNREDKTPLQLAVELGRLQTTKIISHYYTGSKSDLEELVKISGLTQNTPIKEYLLSLIEDPSKIGLENIPESITPYACPSNNRDNLTRLLKSIGFVHLLPTFAKYSLTFNDLFTMDINFLQKKLRLSEEESIAFSSAIKDILVNSFDKKSFFIDKSSSFNILDACICLSNLNEHLHFIQSSMMALCDRIQSMPLKQETALRQALDANYKQLIAEEINLRESIKNFGVIQFEIGDEDVTPRDKFINWGISKTVISISIGFLIGSIVMRHLIK